jgi:bacillithiol system protein YtxJ
MSFLANMFGQASIPEEWHQIASMDDLDEAELESHNRTIAIFKHSVSCGASAHAKHRMEDGFDLDPERCRLYYLDLLSYRDISTEIARRYDVQHQSPQMIVIQNGKPVFDASHHAVSLDTLKENIPSQ